MRAARERIESIAQAMVAPGRGILAMDESNGTCNKRFESRGIAGTEENRRAYRELLLTTPGISSAVSGAILYDETIHQSSADGIPFVKLMDNEGLLVGIKVDTGAKPLAGHEGETVTEGLDGLRERLEEYSTFNAAFAKWRAVFVIEEGLKPSPGAISANAHALARYAALCQEQGIVPIVEPEVLMQGSHLIEICEVVTRRVLGEVFRQLTEQRAHLPGIVLKPSMVIGGEESPEQGDVDEVARRTLDVLTDCVPASVPGIAFLSGGQPDDLATAHLRRINQVATNSPRRLTFSFGRALQRKALQSWAGSADNVDVAQQALLAAVEANAAASLGRP